MPSIMQLLRCQNHIITNADRFIQPLCALPWQVVRICPQSAVGLRCTLLVPVQMRGRSLRLAVLHGGQAGPVPGGLGGQRLGGLKPRAGGNMKIFADENISRHQHSIISLCRNFWKIFIGNVVQWETKIKKRKRYTDNTHTSKHLTTFN